MLKFVRISEKSVPGSFHISFGPKTSGDFFTFEFLDYIKFSNEVLNICK